MGVAATNTWKLYDIMYKDEKRQKKAGLPPKWTHAEFLKEHVFHLMWHDESKAKVDCLRVSDDASLSKSTSRSGKSVF